MTTALPPATLTSARSASSSSKPARYHPAVVALHWLTVILILSAALLAGDEGEGRREFGPGGPPAAGFQPRVPPSGFRPSEAAAGFSTIDVHMILGITILVLLIVRLVLRWRTDRPAWATAGSPFLDRLGELTHWALYLFTFLMTITGIVLAGQRGLLARLLGLTTAAQPAFRRGAFSFGEFHGLIWVLLVALIALHVAAALYHQFFVKDNLLARMWFGKRSA